MVIVKSVRFFNKRTVQRIMRENGWNCIVKPKKYHHKPGTAAIVAENVLNRDFAARRQLKVQNILS